MNHLETISSTWLKIPRSARIAVSAIAVIVAINVILAVINAATSSGAVTGPRSSSYSTAPDGTAGLFDLLSEQGFDTVRSRRLPAAEPQDSGAMMVLDPGLLARPDARALRRFAEAGGRLIVGGEVGKEGLSTILGSAPTWSSDGPRTSRPVVPLAEVASIESVNGEGAGWWSAAGAGAPLLTGGDRPTLLAANVGSGRVLLLADTSPLHNKWLGKTDAAALALALAGESRQRVVFAEVFHGYGAEGLAAVPSEWMWILGALSAATLLLMWNRSRYLGPRGSESLPPLPARIAFVDALSSSVATADGRTATVEALQNRARSVIATRLGIPPNTDERAFRRTAERAGLENRVADALWTHPSNDAEVLAVGRGLAAIHRGEI